MELDQIRRPHPFNLMAFLKGIPKLAHVLVGECAFCLEPHALHLIEVLYS